MSDVEARRAAAISGDAQEAKSGKAMRDPRPVGFGDEEIDIAGSPGDVLCVSANDGPANRRGIEGTECSVEKGRSSRGPAGNRWQGCERAEVAF